MRNHVHTIPLTYMEDLMIIVDHFMEDFAAQMQVILNFPKLFVRISFIFFIFQLQKPNDLVSTNEALLIRFRSDSTMSLKGFSVSYVAVEVVERAENGHANSQELVTPFPGSLKSIYANKLNNNDDDEVDTMGYDKKETYNELRRNDKKSKQKIS